MDRATRAETTLYTYLQGNRGKRKKKAKISKKDRMMRERNIM
jgi:hypothetical protein